MGERAMVSDGRAKPANENERIGGGEHPQPGNGATTNPTSVSAWIRQIQKKVQPSPRCQRNQLHVHGGLGSASTDVVGMISRSGLFIGFSTGAKQSRRAR